MRRRILRDHRRGQVGRGAGRGPSAGREGTGGRGDRGRAADAASRPLGAPGGRSAAVGQGVRRAEGAPPVEGSGTRAKAEASATTRERDVDLEYGELHCLNSGCRDYIVLIVLRPVRGSRKRRPRLDQLLGRALRMSHRSQLTHQAPPTPSSLTPWDVVACC